MTASATIGEDCTVAPTAEVPPPGTEGSPPVLGDGATIRAGTVVYPAVRIGREFTTGHHAVVREETEIGDGVVVGTQSVVDGHAELGDGCSLQTAAYVPSHTQLGDRVFLGPGATLTNDPAPVREESELRGPTLEDDVSVGANATILPDVTVGEGAFVAAGSVVTEDVPPETLAMGSPAEHRPLPADLEGVNQL